MNFLLRAFSLGLLSAGLAFGQQPASQQPAPAQQPAASQSGASQAAAAAALPDAPTSQAAPPQLQPTGPTAIFDTTMGRITCKLFSAEAPNTVANFIGLAEGTKDWTDPKTGEKMHGKPFYDGTIFHRVISGFMIQGGDPTGTGSGGPGYSLDDEFNANLNFDVPGRLAMANSGRPNTNGSQFFITEAPQASLDQRYTIFGQCSGESMPIVESIALVERDRNDKPLRPVVLNKLTIVQPGQPLPPLPPPVSAPSATAPAAPAPSQP